jgi:hypothetical protein
VGNDILSSKQKSFESVESEEKTPRVKGEMNSKKGRKKNRTLGRL